MKIGSLFSGIGGLEHGLQSAIPNSETLFQVEQDPFARRVLQKHWPHTRRFTDVRDGGAHNLPRVNLLCGGVPCQDISSAGKRAGIDGERSGLWVEFVRIIGELGAADDSLRYIVLENVSAIRARGLDRVLGELASVGYDAEWHCLQAADVGAPHLRDRVFIIGTKTRDIPDADSRRLKGGGEPKETLLPESHRRSLSGPQEVAHASGERQQAARQPREPVCSTENTSGKASGSLADSFWDAEPGVRGVAYGIPKRVDQLRCLGNAVVPQVAELIGREIVKHASKEELCRG